MAMAAAITIAAVTFSSEAEASTCPKARTCAAAHSTEVGISSTAARRSTPPEKRCRNRSARVTSLRFHRGRAKTMPISTRQMP